MVKANISRVFLANILLLDVAAIKVKQSNDIDDTLANKKHTNLELFHLLLFFLTNSSS